MLRVTGKNLKSVIRENVSPDAQIYDGFTSWLYGLAKGFAAHQTVNHMAHEYARGPAHVNTAEGYFSLLNVESTARFIMSASNICIGILRSLIFGTTRERPMTIRGP